MVEYPTTALDRTFHALANPTRRAILTRLSHGRATVLEIAAQFEMSLNGVSKHVKMLEAAGLIQREIRGRTHYCSLKTEPLRAADAWMDYYRRFWSEQLDNLETFLERQNTPDSQNREELP
jgi:DNA-binding transcriptional ArsR family regulator